MFTFQSNLKPFKCKGQPGLKGPVQMKGQPVASATLNPSEGCFSDVRGPLRTNKPQNIPQHISYENCSQFWRIFVKNAQKYL